MSIIRPKKEGLSAVPWKAVQEHGNFYREIWDSTGTTVAAEIKTDEHARLIAAAPELLEALKMILSLAEQYLRKAPSHPDNAKLETARAAILKAEGAQ